MNASTRNYHLVSAALFAAVALLQLGRVALGLPVTIGATALPVAASLLAAAAAAALATWGWRTR